jgi:hypothetical protein
VPFVSVAFQPISEQVPDGYQPDYGVVYGDRGNGFTYGWDVDNSANTAVRHVNPDPRYDRLIAMEVPGGGQVWEIALPNGTYDVHLVSGDPSFVNSIYEVAINSVLATRGGVNSAQPYQEAWRRIEVTDGLLVLSNAAGSRNNKINFIEINRIDRGSDTNTFTRLIAMMAPANDVPGPGIAWNVGGETGRGWAPVGEDLDWLAAAPGLVSTSLTAERLIVPMASGNAFQGIEPGPIDLALTGDWLRNLEIGTQFKSA